MPAAGGPARVACRPLAPAFVRPATTFRQAFLLGVVPNAGPTSASARVHPPGRLPAPPGSPASSRPTKMARNCPRKPATSDHCPPVKVVRRASASAPPGSCARPSQPRQVVRRASLARPLPRQIASPRQANVCPCTLASLIRASPTSVVRQAPLRVVPDASLTGQCRESTEANSSTFRPSL